MPKILKSKKDTIGLRMPDNVICNAIVETQKSYIRRLASGNGRKNIRTRKLLMKQFGKLVDYVIDGGPEALIPSTVVDCTTGEWIVTRQGRGEWSV